MKEEEKPLNTTLEELSFVIILKKNHIIRYIKGTSQLQGRRQTLPQTSIMNSNISQTLMNTHTTKMEGLK